ncbi:24837_t:CDS:1, partial [Gigaspora rosea]
VENENDIKAKIGYITSSYCYQYGMGKEMLYYYEIEVEKDNTEDNGMF